MKSDIVLKELYKDLLDQKILTTQKQSLEKRIILKLNSLGIKGSTYSDVVIRISGVRDKFADAFHKAEQLIKDRDLIVEELSVIENTLKEVREVMKDSKELEYIVFSLHYIDKMNLKEIADKKQYSLVRIKQINSDINKKIACQ